MVRFIETTETMFAGFPQWRKSYHSQPGSLNCFRYVIAVF